jgi:tetratricopeptide (TPR) repeat protein
MAKLPSAALVGLAFAQVASGIEMMRADGGDEAIADLIAAVHELDGDLDGALARTRGVDLQGFEERVRLHVEQAELYRIPGVRSFEALDELPFEFAPEGGPSEAGDEDEVRRSIEDRQARDWTLLGDRLKGRGHHEAAVIEYEKALERLGHSEPLVVNRMALALLERDLVDEALPLLEGLLRDHPTLTTTLDNLAEIHLRFADRAARGRNPETEAMHLERALALARRSESVNPFNADVHVRLVSLQRRLGLLDEAETSRERLRMLAELN